MQLHTTTLIHDLPLTLASQVAEPLIAAVDDEDTAMPADLRSWLVSLRLLNGVPFANLVADTELLPMESIRWFYLDRRWTDALVQGALSVGTVTTDDRVDLSAAYPAIRAELDTEERNVRRLAGTARFGGQVGAVSGFILRSAAVAGWPGLHVRAFSVDPMRPTTPAMPTTTLAACACCGWSGWPRACCSASSMASPKWCTLKNRDKECSSGLTWRSTARGPPRWCRPATGTLLST